MKQPRRLDVKLLEFENIKANDSKSKILVSMSNLRADDYDGSISGAGPPSLHHVHEFNEGVGAHWDLLLHGPAGQLEQLTRLGVRLDPRHQLSQRHDLFIDPKHPRLYVRIVRVRQVIFRTMKLKKTIRAIQ